jgi:cyclin-dependent kinase 7
VYNNDHNLHIIYEFLDTDLEAIISDSDIILKESDIKAYMKMILEGIKVCHDNWILHRV